MAIYVALLRGINVSGQKVIKMEDLKRAFEALHYKKVTTYIQSGNVVFESNEKSAPLIRSLIENKLLKTFGYAIPVTVKTPKELEAATRRNPFKNVRTEKGERLHVSFLSGNPSKAAAESLAAVKSNIDEIRLSGSEVYILCRKGYGTTIYSNTFIEKRLALSATTRNWDTVQKLLSICSTITDD